MNASDHDVVEDGFGGRWVKHGPGCDLQVVRPGKVQCSCEDPSTPERQDLRGRLREVAKDAFASEKRPDGVRLLSDLRNPWRALEDAVDAVLAELADDPGDLPKRMADAIKAAAYVCPGNDCQLTEAECQGEHPITLVASHRPHDGSAEVVFVEGTTVALAEAVMSVRSELGAHMAARIAVAERDLEDAKVELASTQGQLGDYRALLKRTTEQRDALKAELAEARDRLRVTGGAYDRLDAAKQDAEAARDRWRVRAEESEAELAQAHEAIERVKEAVAKYGEWFDGEDALAALDASQRPEDTTAMHHADDCWISTHQTGTCNCGAERPEDIREEAG